MTNKDNLYRVEARCKMCDEFLLGTEEKPHLSKDELGKMWTRLVTSAPLNATACPNCEYSSGSDYNAGLNFFIDDGENVVTSDKFFKSHK